MSDYQQLFIENAVCHFTSMETALLHILPEGKIRFSALRKLNDPLEYNDFHLVSREHRDIRNKSEEHEAFRGLSSRLRAWVETLKIACFCQNIFDGRVDWTNHDRLAFLKPRMWSQYAQSHSGVCLVLDRIRIKAQTTQSGFSTTDAFVEYHESTVLFDRHPSLSFEAYQEFGPDLSFEKMKAAILQDYLGLKHRDYEHESEYRLIIETDAGTDYMKVPFEDALLGIVVSDRADPGPKIAIETYCQKLDIPYLSVTWNQRIPHLFQM